jgi:hypothetical protein
MPASHSVDGLLARIAISDRPTDAISGRENDGELNFPSPSHDKQVFQATDQGPKNGLFILQLETRKSWQGLGGYNDSVTESDHRVP